MRNRKNPLNPFGLLAALGVGPWYAPRGVVFNKPGGEAGGGSGAPPASGSGGEGEEGSESGGEGEEGSESGGEGEEGDKPAPPPPEATVKKTQYDALFAENKKNKNKLRELETRVAALPSAEEMEEFRQARVEKERLEEENKKKAGQFDQVIHKIKAEAETKIKELESQVSAANSRWQGERIGNALANEIPKHTNAPIADVASLIRGPLSVDENGDVVILDADGEPIMGANGKQMTVAEYVEVEIAKRAYLATAKTPPGSGTAPQKGPGTTKGKKIFTADEIRNMSAEDWKKNEKAIMEQAA